MWERLGIPVAHDGKLWNHQSNPPHRVSHRHAEVELNLVVRGHAAYVMRDRRYDLSANMLVWLFPSQEHLLVSESHDYEMWVGAFRPRLLRRVCTASATRPLLSSDPPGLFCKRLSLKDAEHLTNVFCSLTTVPSTLSRHNTGVAYALLSAWEAYLRSNELPDSFEVHPAVEKTTRLLAETDEHLSLDDLADSSGLSSSHLSRLFKRQVGQSIVQFRNRQRLRRFFAAYSNGYQVTMLKAALDAGFNSYTQFYRVFASLTGQTPREYCNELANRSSRNSSWMPMPGEFKENPNTASGLPSHRRGGSKASARN